MATINGLYVFITSEDVAYNVSVTEHTVETGIAISDHVKRNAITLSLSGEIVGKNASTILNKLKQMQQSGVLCKYVGRTTLSNCLITEFSTGHPNTIWGGCEFSMTLKEVRTASTSYKPTATKKTQTTTKTGTQQTTAKSTTTYVYHTIKKGDTVWALVAASNAPYKNLSRPKIDGKSYSACDWVMKMSPSAFSRPGDFRTGQIGRKLCVGVRSGTTVTAPTTAKAPTTTTTATSAKKRVVLSVSGSAAYIKKVTLSYVSGGKKYTKTIQSALGVSVSVDNGSDITISVGTGSKHTFSHSGYNYWKISTSGKTKTYATYRGITKEVNVTIKFSKA